ncbi:MAG: alpha/beta hydrolase [Dehalococcoidia bacterium]
MPVERSEVPSTDGTLIPIWKSGSGRPLLIVPGTSTDPRAWDGVRDQIERHVTVAVIERRAILGDPLSQLDMEREFEDVAAVAKGLGDEVDVLGHSSGALCALGASLLAPNLRRLLLFEPPLEEDPVPYQPAMDRMWERLRAADIDGVYDTWLKQYVGIPEEAAEGLKASPAGAAMAPYAQYLPREMASHLAHKWDLKAFADVQTPTLFITGSISAGNEQLRGWLPLLEGVMPNFTMREMPGLDHFAPMLAPGVFAAFLLDCVQSDL